MSSRSGQYRFGTLLGITVFALVALFIVAGLLFSGYGEMGYVERSKYEFLTDVMVYASYWDDNDVYIFGATKFGEAGIYRLVDGNRLELVVLLPESLYAPRWFMERAGGYIVLWGSTQPGVSNGYVILADLSNGVYTDISAEFVGENYLIGADVDEYNGSVYVGAVMYDQSQGGIRARVYRVGDGVVYDNTFWFLDASFESAMLGAGKINMKVKDNGYFFIFNFRKKTNLAISEEITCNITISPPRAGCHIAYLGVSPSSRSMSISGVQVGKYIAVVSLYEGNVGLGGYYIPANARTCTRRISLPDGYLAGYLAVSSEPVAEGNRVIFQVLGKDKNGYFLRAYEVMDVGSCAYRLVADYNVNMILQDSVTGVLSGRDAMLVFQSGEVPTKAYLLYLDNAHDFELNILDASYSDGNLTITFSYFVDVSDVRLFWKISETNCYGRYTLDPELNTLTVTEPCDLPEGNWTITAVVDPDDLFYDVNTANNFAAYTITVTAPAPTPPPAGGGGGAAAAPPVVEENVVQPVQPQPSQLAVAPAIPTSWVILAVLLFVLAYVLYRYSTKG